MVLDLPRYIIAPCFAPLSLALNKTGSSLHNYTYIQCGAMHNLFPVFQNTAFRFVSKQLLTSAMAGRHRVQGPQHDGQAVWGNTGRLLCCVRGNTRPSVLVSHQTERFLLDEAKRGCWACRCEGLGQWELLNTSASASLSLSISSSISTSDAM
eukprot:COSAG06_NODE_13980_length_1200_cov_2.573115_2_plen_153_part_01